MTDFEMATGIPKERAYKWKQRGNIPKAEDVKAVQNWLDKVPQETPPGDDVGAKLSAHEAMLSVLLDSTAALLSAASGENETVVRRRLQKAAEDYLKIGGV